MTPQEVTNRPSELRRAAQLSGLGVSEQKRVDTRLKWAATLALIALAAALIYAWPEPRHSDTLTVSDGWVGK